MTDTRFSSSLVSAQLVAQELHQEPHLTILDVRTPAEYAAEHVAQSCNIPLDQIAAHTMSLHAILQGPTVLICRSGARAHQAAQLLSAAAIPQVHVLDGGMMAWTSAGLPVVRGQAPWSLERQVRGVAGGLVVLSAVSGWFLWKPLTAIAAVVGAGLTLSAITDSCLMAQVLSHLPFNRVPVCSSADVIAQLQAAR